MSDQLAAAALEWRRHILGIEVERIDITAWLPPDAKVAFDAVLTATQAADRGVADGTNRRRAQAPGSRTGTRPPLSAAQATALELVSSANVDTFAIRALEREETPQTRASLLQRAYRAGIADIMDRVGSEPWSIRKAECAL